MKNKYICTMYSWNRYRHLLLFFAILPFFSACVIETAKPAAKQSVTIYTDCLGKNDRLLFRNFRKKEHILVKIVHLPADSLIALIKREGYSTSADLVILKSLYHTYKARKAAIFQPLKNSEMDNLTDRRYKSKDNTWFGIGINPCVFIARHDTLSTIAGFSELVYKKNKGKWSTNLEKRTDLIPLLAPVFYKKKMQISGKWFRTFIENDYTGAREADENGVPLMTTDILVTDYYSYNKMSERNDSTDFDLQLIFPNQAKRGTYYNLVCAGVVRQARNYENAKLLLEYISNVRMNEKINNTWKTFPISMHEITHPYAYQNTPFKLFKGYTSKIMTNYPNAERIVKKHVKY